MLAVERLKDNSTHDAVEKLKATLNHDKFYGVRIEAANALRAIHTDESLAALLDSLKQSDARVRNQVMTALAGFYDPRAREAGRSALAAEHNPDIQAAIIRGLGNYAQADVRQLLLPFLESQSYRNSLLNAAISALRSQDDPAALAPIREALKRRKPEMTTRGFAAGLDALAGLARDTDRKDEARDFLIGYVNDKKEGIQLGAIKALGTLGDARAAAVLETFANASPESRAQPAAVAALAAIRAAGQPADNLRELRQTVLDLQKEERTLRQDLETLQKKTGAKTGARAASRKGSQP